jgi:uncharacterized protein (TIGR03435 family)
LAAAGLLAVTIPVMVGISNSQLWAQTGAARGASQDPPVTSTFDVASIKPSKSSDAPESIRPFLHGGFSARNATVQELVSWANYPVEGWNVFGGPGWIRSNHYDIEAKVVTPDDNTPPELFQARLRALLADRFKLVTHRETRDLPVYELVVVKNGPKLTETKDSSCVVPVLTAPLPAPGPGQEPPCGYLFALRNRMSGAGVEIARVADALSHILSRNVADKTGLTARYDVHLEWTSDSDPGPIPSQIQILFLRYQMLADLPCSLL